MRRVPGLVLVLLLAVLARPSFADITGFIGASTTPESRQVTGVAVGSGLLLLGFEIEYAATAEEAAKLAPSLRSGMGNVLLQTPLAILRMQPYFTIGAGVYRERLGTDQDTGVGFNTGGGLKITLAGPLRLRLDYRLFKLGDEALYSRSHRVYAGLNLKF